MQEPQETSVRSLGQEDPLEEEVTTHSSILSWKIPWTEEPDGLQSMGSQKHRTRLKWLSSSSMLFRVKIYKLCHLRVLPSLSSLPTCSHDWKLYFQNIPWISALFSISSTNSAISAGHLVQATLISGSSARITAAVYSTTSRLPVTLCYNPFLTTSQTVLSKYKSDIYISVTSN